MKLLVLSLLIPSLGLALPLVKDDDLQRCDTAADLAAKAILPRFKSISDNRFGLTRAVMAGRHKLSYAGPVRKDEVVHGFRWVFAPDSPDQRQVVQTLANQGKEVAFYSVGLGKEDRFSGPAYMQDSQFDAPQFSILKSEFRKVKVNPVQQDRAFLKKSWVFYTKPVLASSPTCVKCHNDQVGEAKYKLGSTIGVLVLAVRHRA